MRLPFVVFCGYRRGASSIVSVGSVQERDAYGNEVGVSAKRVPVAYLLVDVPCGVAGDAAAATFAPRAAFPPAHRPLQHQLQTLRALHAHLQAADGFLEAASDLHVLLFLASNEALPLSPAALEPLLRAVRERDAAAADAWRSTPSAATLDQLTRAAADHDNDRYYYARDRCTFCLFRAALGNFCVFSFRNCPHVPRKLIIEINLRLKFGVLH